MIINLLHNKRKYITGGQTKYIIVNGTYKSVLLECDKDIFNYAISSSLKFKGLQRSAIGIVVAFEGTLINNIG